MAETTYHWQRNARNFTKATDIRAIFDELFEGEFDPQIMIDAMIEIIPDESSKFRNVVPQQTEEFCKAYQEGEWTKTLWSNSVDGVATSGKLAGVW